MRPGACGKDAGKGRPDTAELAFEGKRRVGDEETAAVEQIAIYGLSYQHFEAHELGAGERAKHLGEPQRRARLLDRIPCQKKARGESFQALGEALRQALELTCGL